MFFILSKILFYIAMPLVWIFSLLIYSYFTKKETRRKVGILCCIGMIFFFGNEFIANEAFSCWEKPPVSQKSLSTYDYGIVLTGVTNTEKEPIDDRVYFSKGADRLLHTVQLYKIGKIKKIIISGGSASIVSKPVIESHQLKKAFLYCGVPEKDLILEDKSRNTHENATYTKKLIDSLQLKGSFLLITSAFHMKRSEDCFKKAGLNFSINPVDYYTKDTKFTPNLLFIPLESAFSKWSLLIHEVIGYITYKTMGYC